MTNPTNTIEKGSSKTYEKVIFAVTLISFLSACALAIAVLWKQGSYETSLPVSFFMSPIFWVIATAVTIWYIYEFGFPRTKNRNTDGSGKTILATLSMFVPFFVGFIVGLAAYYLLYWLSVLFMASIGYILIAAIIALAIFVTIFLSRLVFKPKEDRYRQLFLFLSLLGAIALLILSIWWITGTKA